MTHACRLVPRALYPRWSTPERLQQFIRFCQGIDAEEAMLFPTGQLVHPGWLTRQQTKERVAQLQKARRRLAAAGIELTINECCFSDDLGLSTGLPQSEAWPWAVDITGKTAVGYRCFLSDKVRQAAAQRLVAMASTGAARIFVDDEVRHDWHPSHTRNDGAHYCFCPAHIKEFQKFAQCQITREALAKALQSDSPQAHALRKQWLAFKRQVLLDFIQHCQRAVHRAHPKVRLGQMTTFFHFATLGGISFKDQVQAWAGKLQPLCRPAQGWYGDHDRTGLILGLAQTLWTLHGLPPGTEIYSEVDWGCPWTQLKHSARMAGDFQIKANLLLNIKTQSLLYLGEGPDEPLIEKRLVARLSKSRKLFDGLAANLPADAERVGLQFLMTEKLAEKARLVCRGPAGDAADPWGVTGAGLGLAPWALSFGTLARCGLPLTFGEAPLAVLSGGIAPALGKEATAELLETKNLIVDGSAAADLEALGLLARLGVERRKELDSVSNERLTQDAFNGPARGEVVPISQLVSPARIRLYQRAPRLRCQYRVLSHIISPDGEVRGDGVVLVKGLPRDRKACLLPFDLSEENPWGFQFRKQQWHGILSHMAEPSLAWPAWLDDVSEVWPLTYRRRSDERLWLGLINFGHDAADDVTCWIPWRGAARVRYVDEQGRLRQVPGSQVQKHRGFIALQLRDDHQVAPLDVRLFIVEPPGSKSPESSVVASREDVQE